MAIEELANAGNVHLAQVEGRKFPGLLIQGDSLYSLLEDLEEEAPDSVAAEKVLEWLQTYEELMSRADRPLPYRR
jgi:hypothetical protein